MSAPALKTGDTLLGRYVLETRLGEGLGGETWRAVPVGGGQPVAIKVVVASFGRSQRDLLNEAAFLRELDHPHIVPYLGVVDLPGVDATFLVTEYAEGGNLWQWATARGPCAPVLAALLLAQVVEALEAVHAKGILHRDLKPQNVLVRPVATGVPCLLVADFGISRRIVENSASLTRHLGTLGYGAPEVWSKSTVSAAADVFSLGALGWFLLAGVDPDPRPGRMHPDARDLQACLSEVTRIDGAVLVALLAEMLAAPPTDRPPLRDVRRRLLTFIDGASPGRLTGNGPRLHAVTMEDPVTVGPPAPAPAARVAAPTGGDPLPPVRDSGEKAPVSPTFDMPRVTAVPVLPGDDADDGAPPVAAPPARRLGRRLALAALLLIAVCAGGVWRLTTAEGPNAAAPAPDPRGLLPPAETNARAAPVAPEDISLVPAATLPDAPPAQSPAPTSDRPTARQAPAPEALHSPGVAVETPRVAVETPRPASMPAPSGPVHRLRVGLDAPAGLPADATLVVRANGGIERSAQSTQVVVSDIQSGMVTVEVRSSTRVLASDVIAVPPGNDVKVLCRALAADFSGMRCGIRE